MRILVTGSSGWLGQTLVPQLRREGHEVIGLDPLPSAYTQIVGSIVDRELVRATMRDFAITAVIHAGALHKPQVATRAPSDFISVNVQGTLNLLEAAVEPHATVERFVFTSTTSVMVSHAISAGRRNGATRAAWITEATAPLLPRNIYGISKLAAEHLCRLFHARHDLPLVILRTSRFFPEEDDMANTIVQSERNTKVNEMLYRRLAVEDAAASHIAALNKAPELGFDTFIISARTPFVPDDCEELMVNAPSVVARYFPHPEVYARLGWTMFQSIDRVYDAGRAARRLGFVCATGFGEMLEQLESTVERKCRSSVL
jgi:nucleoside-diphosphate-sugar epimerase